MTNVFAVTFDYRCPFARNAHEAVVRGLAEGRDWDVHFLPFSLDQTHAAEGEAPVWERPPAERGGGVLALEWGIAVRDLLPEQFLEFHVACFAARHDEALDLRDPGVLAGVAEKAGADPDAVAAEVASGRPLATLAGEHVEAVRRWNVWGVPTFIGEDRAVFIRFMERGRLDDLDRALELLPWSRFNEFKATSIPR